VADARTSEVGVILNVTAEMSIMTTLIKQIVVPALILATKLINIAVVTIPQALLILHSPKIQIQNAKVQQTHAKFA